jgi:hypothetical protein
MLLDGQPVRSYAPIYLVGGRVVGPIEPFVTRLARGITYGKGVAIVTGDDRTVRVRVLWCRPGSPMQGYVSLGPLLRELGATVRLDRRNALVLVASPPVELSSPAPFDPRAPRASPQEVFTPEPVPTPRPAWTGSPRPRRTPIPRTTSLPPPGKNGP